MTGHAEQIHYKDPYIPYYVLRTFGNRTKTAGIMHWHQDIEICVVLGGRLNTECSGQKYHIEEGNGIFFNSKQVHGGLSPNCDHICLRLNPILLCVDEYFEQNFVIPLISNPDISCLVLDQHMPWQKRIIDIVKEVYMYDAANEVGMPLLIERYFFELWQLLYANTPKPKVKEIYEPANMSTLKVMTSFIRENYMQKLKLGDIAKAGNVSPSTCSVLFTKLIHQSPISYLTTYRLNEAQKLLRKTSMSVGQIAEATGFSGTSYFTEVFHRETGMTPREYRNNRSIESNDID